MDLQLQAILDAPSSDEDEDGVGHNQIEKRGYSSLVSCHYEHSAAKVGVTNHHNKPSTNPSNNRIDNGVHCFERIEDDDDIVRNILKPFEARGKVQQATGHSYHSYRGQGLGNLELERILRDSDVLDDCEENEEEMEEAKHDNAMEPKYREYPSIRTLLQAQELDILHSILNEEDDDHDENDDDIDEKSGANYDYESFLSRENSKESLRLHDGIQKYLTNDEINTINIHGGICGDANEIDNNFSSQFNTTNSSVINHVSYSKEVDAILNSFKDDDDDDENDEITYSYGLSKLNQFSRQERVKPLQSISSSCTISNISDDEDEDDQNIGLNFNLKIKNMNSFKQQLNSSSLSHVKGISFDDDMSSQYPLSRSKMASQIEKEEWLNHSQENSDSKHMNSSVKEEEWCNSRDNTSKFLSQRNPIDAVGEGDETFTNLKGEDGTCGYTVVNFNSLTDEQQCEKDSVLNLNHAEEYERCLLKPSTRNIISPLTVKRRMKPKVTLMSKSRTDQFLSSSSSSCQQAQQYNAVQIQQQQPRFGFSGGIIQMKSMTSLGVQILKTNAQQKLPNQKHMLKTGSSHQEPQDGLPTALAVNSKFIAVGTQRGIIWIFDLFEQLKMTLCGDTTVKGPAVGTIKSISGALESCISVTSIDLPVYGDYLLAGYISGTIILWDTIKGTILKSTNDLHTSPITSVRLSSSPVANAGGSDRNDIGAVSVDAGGLVNKLLFSKGLLWSTYSIETECLLDGTAGQILAMDTLPPMDVTQHSEGGIDYHPSMLKIVLIALSSERSSFAVSILPKVSVLHRWARPSPERIDPSIADLDQSTEVESNFSLSSFASTHLTASTYQSNPANMQKSQSGQIYKIPFLPCLSWGWGLVSGGRNSVTPILARAWGCCIQFLCAIYPPQDENDTSQDDTIIHWPAFGLHDEFNAASPVVALNWLGKRSLAFLTLTNEFAIIDTVIMTMQERLDFSGIKLVYAEFTLSRPRQPDSNLCSTFMNSIRSNDNRLLVLCEKEIKIITMLGIRQQIMSLEDGGEWLEALALALDHYESTIQSQEDRRRDSEKDSKFVALPNSTKLTEDEIWMEELLMRYLMLAIENAPEPDFSNKGLSLAHSHFEMLSGVCLEYCITLRRIDLLFGQVFRSFYQARYINVFLDVMETYVLNDRLRYIAPDAMVLVFAHYRDIKDLSMLERCLLHMDCSLMDFDTILALLEKNALYTGLFHVYCSGLDDFVSPLKKLFQSVFEEINTADCNVSNCRHDGVLSSKIKQYAYKALVYLKYCFTGKIFPQGSSIFPEERRQTVRIEVMNFLFCESINLPHQHYQSAPIKSLRDRMASSYPYLRALLLVDARAFFDTLAIVLDDPESKFVESSGIDNIGSWEIECEIDGSVVLQQCCALQKNEDFPGLLPDRQMLVNILSSIIMTDSLFRFDNQFTPKECLSVVSIRVKNVFLDFLAKYIQLRVVTAPRYITGELFTRLCSKKSASEDQVLSLLRLIPLRMYELDEVLYTVEKANMTRGAIFLHQLGVGRTFDCAGMTDKCQYYFSRSIDCYLHDKDDNFKKEVFEYARKECSSRALISTTSNFLLKTVLLQYLPNLVKLDAVRTAKLFGELFVDDFDMILTSLQRNSSGKIVYEFLRAIISELPKLNSEIIPLDLELNLTTNHNHIYLELMARFEPDMVYQYLSTNRNYRVDDALKLCQERQITDASAYLLERTGDVSGALNLMLQSLDTRMVGLESILIEKSPNVHLSHSRINYTAIVKENLQNDEAAKKEFASAKQILMAILDLCERNKNDCMSQGSQDNVRGPLLWFHVLDRLINIKNLLRLSNNTTEYHSTLISTLFSELLLMTMQRMISNVSLFDLMHKLTRDHAGSNLGEFREMLVSMFKTYSSELGICSNAVNVMYDDIRKLSICRRYTKVRGVYLETHLKCLSKTALLELSTNGSIEVISDGHKKDNTDTEHDTKYPINAVSLLQRRKRAQKSILGGYSLTCMQRRNKVNFLTASEREFFSSDCISSCDSFDNHRTRQYGALSEAQNVGGL